MSRGVQKDVCKKKSGGNLPGSFLDSHSVDILRSVMNFFQQLRGVQTAEPLLGDQQHLPDDRRGVLHPLEPLRPASVRSLRAATGDSIGLLVRR